jgi:hypothetical protein
MPAVDQARWAGRSGGRQSQSRWRHRGYWCQNVGIATGRRRITITEPGIAGCYELVERRDDGSLLLRPERERLSDAIRETEGVIFKDEEFIAHLQRLAATEDDLPPDSNK